MDMSGQNPYPMAVADPLVQHQLKLQAAEEKQARENLPFNWVEPLRGKSDRQKFVIKVYGILAATLLFTTAVSAIVMSSEAIKDWMQENWWLHFTSIAVAITLMCIL
jgi:FtsH-binding integral membrane protein